MTVALAPTVARRVEPGERLYTVAATRAIDAAAIEAGIPGIELMERAGAAAFAVLRARWPAARRIAVLAGAGNNGADGFIVARLARAAGFEVALCFVGDSGRMSADAKLAVQRWTQAGEVDSRAPDAAAPAGSAAWTSAALSDCDVVVDALLGIGLNSAPREPLASLLGRLASRTHPPVLALDVPSGLDADTGATPGPALRAAATVSFITAKRGLCTGAARGHTGDSWVAPLGVGAALGSALPCALLDGITTTRALLPARVRTAHKGHFGHVLLVGGDHGLGGAIRLAAEAAARAGAGLTSVATRPEHVAPLLTARPEVMVRGVDTPAGIEALVARASVIGIGPGLGTGTWGADLLNAVIASQHLLVLDADALNLLASGAASLAPSRAPRVLTPHPGEAARLLGTSPEDVEANRCDAVVEIANRYTASVVLKGAGTVVADTASDGDGRGAPLVYVNAEGNPGMASGGMGDVLTGVVAALLAQRLAPIDAARLGVAAHAAAADHAARNGGERGLLAGDVVAALRTVLNGPAAESPAR